MGRKRGQWMGLAYRKEYRDECAEKDPEFIILALQPAAAGRMKARQGNHGPWTRKAAPLQISFRCNAKLYNVNTTCPIHSPQRTTSWETGQVQGSGSRHDAE